MTVEYQNALAEVDYILSITSEVSIVFENVLKFFKHKRENLSRFYV